MDKRSQINFRVSQKAVSKSIFLAEMLHTDEILAEYDEN